LPHHLADCPAQVSVFIAEIFERQGLRLPLLTKRLPEDRVDNAEDSDRKEPDTPKVFALANIFRSEQNSNERDRAPKNRDPEGTSKISWNSGISRHSQQPSTGSWMAPILAKVPWAYYPSSQGSSPSVKGFDRETLASF
jgi:hypothetical protein